MSIDQEKKNELRRWLVELDMASLIQDLTTRDARTAGKIQFIVDEMMQQAEKIAASDDWHRLIFLVNVYYNIFVCNNPPCDESEVCRLRRGLVSPFIENTGENSAERKLFCDVRNKMLEAMNGSTSLMWSVTFIDARLFNFYALGGLLCRLAFDDENRAVVLWNKAVGRLEDKPHGPETIIRIQESLMGLVKGICNNHLTQCDPKLMSTEDDRFTCVEKSKPAAEFYKLETSLLVLSEVVGGEPASWHNMIEHVRFCWRKYQVDGIYTPYITGASCSILLGRQQGQESSLGEEETKSADKADLSSLTKTTGS